MQEPALHLSRAGAFQASRTGVTGEALAPFSGWFAGTPSLVPLRWRQRRVVRTSGGPP
jgi:hypothetical protein